MSTPIVNTHRLPPGTILEDRYEVTGFIGVGGFAQVYRGQQLAINRPVAIKILQSRESFTDQAAFEERFLREAQTAAQIRHPNVVTIYDYGVTGHQPYIVMELLEGHDLSHELKRGGGMAPDRILRLFIKCLDALGDGHRQGIIHKDLKPANLYLNDPGTRKEMLKILDFGIARLGQESHLTSTGQLMGTPKYYAPEYIKTQIVTPALDVYQMGLILVECFTRRPVVDVDDPYVCLMRHSLGDLEIPQSLMKGPLGAVLAMAMALDHTQRYPNAHVFRDALETIDPATIEQVQVGEPMCRLSETSGSLMTSAVYPGPSTGTGPLSLPNHTGGRSRSPSGSARPPSGPFPGDDSARARVSRGARMRSTSQSQAMPSPAQPEATRPRRTALWVGLGVAALALLLLLGGGAGMAWFMNQDEEIAAGPPTPSPEPAPPVERQEEPPPTQNMPDFIMGEAQSVKVTIQVDPEGADVILRNERLGQAPFDYNFASEADDPVTLLISAMGYKPQTLTLHPSDAPRAEIKLERDPKVRLPGEAQSPPREVKGNDTPTGVGDAPPPANDTKPPKKDSGGGGILMPPPE